jgi:hypothetical protein
MEGLGGSKLLIGQPTMPRTPQRNRNELGEINELGETTVNKSGGSTCHRKKNQ